MNQPINPPLPLFFAQCVKCGHHGDSLTMATGDKPFTYICFVHQDDATREAVRLHVNAYIREQKGRFPDQVAFARRQLGITMPRSAQHENPNDPSWAGCRRDA